MMTPQLFINYKLKSVAHMPWKTFMYKALNTFVDDLFAFIIKMPTMHRVACFRDGNSFISILSINILTLCYLQILSSSSFCTRDGSTLLTNPVQMNSDRAERMKTRLLPSLKKVKNKHHQHQLSQRVQSKRKTKRL